MNDVKKLEKSMQNKYGQDSTAMFFDIYNSSKKKKNASTGTKVVVN